MNATGHEQVASLAERLRHVRFDAAYTSPLSRACHTASAILINSGVRATEMMELGELSYGAWQGLSPAQWPGDAETLWKNDPWSVRFPDGESLAMVRQRIIPTTARIVAAHPGKNVLISAHGHVNRVLLLETLAPLAFWDIAQPNCAVYRIEYRDDGAAGWLPSKAELIEGACTDFSTVQTEVES